MQTYRKRIIRDINNYMPHTGCHKLYDAHGTYANAIFAWLIKIQNYYEFNYRIYDINNYTPYTGCRKLYGADEIDTRVM